MDSDGNFVIAWQSEGQDTHSIIANPQFADAPGDDYTVPGDSPAVAIGFEPFDLSAAGPQLPPPNHTAGDPAWMFY